ncbi:MAG: SGNH/GDSL hydrolase family protein [Edaphocola sp.]
MKQYIPLLSIIATMAIGSCKPGIEPVKPSAGQADFSTYVSIGNSLTAGYADGSLYRSGQENSYPSMLAAQFKLAGGGDFKQPLLPGNAGWPGLKRVLGYSTDCAGTTALGPIYYTGSSDTAGSATNIASAGPYNNVGIPGIRCIDYTLTGYGMLNPYATRFFSNPATQRAIDVALQPIPTFFTLWLGANDVLGYATSGGSGVVGGVTTIDISPQAAFKASYDAVVKALVDIGAKGVLINIPDVTSVPFFTTVPAKGLALTSEAQVTALNTAYAALGISFSLGANYFIIADASATGGLRQIKDGEYILLSVPQDSIKCAGWGSAKPIPAQYVLDATEVANVQEATTYFNQVIADNASQYNLALMDADSYLGTLKSGITWNGVTFSPTYVTGGAFSLDGVHLTPRGYALVANQIIKVVNAQYGATLSEVDVNKYNGILYP